MCWRLENHGIAHHQRRDHGGEGLVHRVVEGTHAQYDAKRGAANLGDHAFLLDKTRVRVIDLLDRIDGGAHVFDGAVEFLFRVGEAFADFPQNELNNLASLDADQADEMLQAGDPLGDQHRRPDAAAVVIGAHRAGQCRQCFVAPHVRLAADLERRQRAIGLTQANGRNHLARIALPDTDFTIDQVGALMDRREQA